MYDESLEEAAEKRRTRDHNGGGDLSAPPPLSKGRAHPQEGSRPDLRGSLEVGLTAVNAQGQLRGGNPKKKRNWKLKKSVSGLKQHDLLELGRMNGSRIRSMLSFAAGLIACSGVLVTSLAIWKFIS